MATAPIMLILGSGLEGLYSEHVKSRVVRTRYGNVAFSAFREGGIEVYALYRHGPDHSIAPHKVNYHAFFAAAKKLGVGYIIATSAVGSVSHGLKLGDYVVIDQFLDFTRHRAHTLFKGKTFRHTDMANPYSDEAKKALTRAIIAGGSRIHKGTYACVDGPRYETAAEIRMFRLLGADVVGMTEVPSVIFANELGIPYATLAIVTNLGSGMGKGISHKEVIGNVAESAAATRSILDSAIHFLARRGSK